ncbi:MAG: dienelactone hydrolase family protein [Limisphaerales bacterium]
MNTLPPETSLDLHIPIGNLSLRGDLIIPENALGLVLFAHGSGSGRKSSRNRFVASVLQNHRIGTLLFDLLTEQEEITEVRTAHLRFDIPLLAQRLVEVTNWAREPKAGRATSPTGYFGASTGAAAALYAAAQFGEIINAVVSRGGRPDLADRVLPDVTAPTLLIVGSLDHPVIEMNRCALSRLKCEKKMEIIPGATHLFEEPGTLEAAARLAANWFSKYFSAAR